LAILFFYIQLIGNFGKNSFYSFFLKERSPTNYHRLNLDSSKLQFDNQERLDDTHMSEFAQHNYARKWSTLFSRSAGLPQPTSIQIIFSSTQIEAINRLKLEFE
jgi:hypothetical protein